MNDVKLHSQVALIDTLSTNVCALTCLETGCGTRFRSCWAPGVPPQQGALIRTIRPAARTFGHPFPFAANL